MMRHLENMTDGKRTYIIQFIFQLKEYPCNNNHDILFLIYHVLCTYPVIPSFVYVCIYFECFSPVAIFRTGFSFVEYCFGSFRAFLQSDY